MIEGIRLSCSLNGQLTTKSYDLSDGNDLATMSFSAGGTTSLLMLKLQLDMGVSVSGIQIDRVELYVGNNMFKKFTFSGGDVFNQKWTYLKLDSSFFKDGDGYTIGIDFWYSRKYFGGNPYAWSFVDDYSCQTTDRDANDKCNIYAKVYGKIKKVTYSGDLGNTSVNDVEINETKVIDTINVYAPRLSSISATRGKTEFYKNEKFDYSTLRVQASYKYVVDGSLAYKKLITDYSITSPNMTTKGEKLITVTYGDCSSTYTINVSDVKTFILNGTSKRQYAVGHAFVRPTDATIEYDNGVIDNSVSLDKVTSPNMTTSGSKEVIGYFTSPKTNERLISSYSINVFDLFKITLNTDDIKKSYDPNETLDIHGLTAKAEYGDDEVVEDVGFDLIETEDLDIVKYDTSVVGTQIVNVSYTWYGVTKTDSYSIYVNGIYDIDIDFSNAYGALYNTRDTDILLEKYSLPNLSGHEVYFKRFYDGTYDSNWTYWNKEVKTEYEGDLTSESGTKLVKYSITENGVTLTKEKNVLIYDLNNVQIMQLVDKFYIINGVLPTFRFNGVVSATRDAGDRHFDRVYLIENAFVCGYSVKLVKDNKEYFQGDQLEEGEYELVITLSTGDTYVESTKIEVVNDQPKADATLIVSGNQKTYSVGDTIDLTNFEVKISEMESGETFVSTTNYVATIVGLNRLYFTEEDAIGNYSIKFEVEGLAPVILENIVLLKGVTSITEVSISKTMYKVGEVVDPSSISGKVNYNDGTFTPLTAALIKDLRNTPFTSSEAGTKTNGGFGTLTLTFNVSGVNASVDVNVCQLYLLEFVGTNFNFNIHDRLSFADRGYGFKLYLNDGEGSKGTLYKEIDNDRDVYYKGFYTSDGNEISGCSKNNLIPSTNNVVIATLGYNDQIFGEITHNLTLYVKALSSIELLNNEGEITYKINLYKNDRFSLDGYKLKVTYNDSSVVTLNIDDNFSGGIIPSLGTQITNKANGRIGYSFSNETKYFNFVIDITYISNVDINLNGLLEKTYYEDQVLDLSSVEASATVTTTDEDSLVGDIVIDITDDLVFKLDGVVVDEVVALSSAGTHILRIEYADRETIFANNYTLEVNAILLQDIQIETLNSFKLLNTYIEGQSLSLNGLLIHPIYNDVNKNYQIDASIKDQTSFDYSKNRNGLIYEYVGGAYAESISYEEGKTYYIKKNINYGLPSVEIVDASGNEVSKTKKLSIATDNGKTLYVSYGELLPKQIGTLSITPLIISNVSIDTLPKVTSFTYGDKFSPEGLNLRVVYNDGTIGQLDYSMLTYSIDRNHVFNPTDDATFGDIEVTASYEGKSVTYIITLVKPELDRLETNVNDVTQPVQVLFKDGDVFTMSGLIVTGVYKNGWKEIIPTITNNASEVLNLTDDGKINVTGNYGTKQITLAAINPYDPLDSAFTTYNVEIGTSGAIVSAVKKFTSDNYNQYLVGDEFTARGVAFEVTDVDGNTYVVDNFLTSITKGSILRSAGRIEVTCTYTNGSFSSSFTYTIIVNIPTTTSQISTDEYSIAIGTKDGSLFTKITHEEAEIIVGKQYTNYESSNGEEDRYLSSEVYPIFKTDMIAIDDNPSHTDTYGFNVYIGQNPNEDCIGYVDLGVTDETSNEVIKQGHLVLFDDPINPTQGQGNILVEFPHYVSGYAERINKCKFGIVYNNRLFVSGNEQYKNCDWHTSETNNNTNEFTYFSDLDYCFYGSADTAIVGYDIYADGDMIVVKESSNDQATLYRRSYKVVSASNYSGDIISSNGNYGEDAFPMFDINANGGVGGLSYRSITNFVGDTIILTKNGLKALTSKNEIYNSAKYTYDVSSFINPKIIYEDLINALLFAFNEKLILKTSRGIYIGYYELRNENREYEWYFLNNINADLFFEIDEELYFANDEGEIYRFNKNVVEYIDRNRIFTGIGGIRVNELSNKVEVSKDYAEYIIEYAPFHILTTFRVDGIDTSSIMFANLGTFVNKETRKNAMEKGEIFDQTLYSGLIDATDNTIEIIAYKPNGEIDEIKTSKIDNLFYDGREVYIDQIVGSNERVSIDTKYTLKKNGNKYQFITYTNDGKEHIVNLLGVEYFRISFAINDLSVTNITNITDTINGGKEFEIMGDHGQVLDLIHYNNRNDRYSGVIGKEESVKAHFITAPYTMANMVLNKTIWQWVIANDTSLNSLMDVGYISSRKQGDFEMSIKSSSGAKQLNFVDNFSFNRVQFTSDKLPHIYSKNRVVANVGFIRFMFRNYFDSNMVLTTLQVVYTISQFTKGAK